MKLNCSLLGESCVYGINPKTVQKWRRRSSVEDAPIGPKERRSTVLSVEEEALIMAFRKYTLLPPRLLTAKHLMLLFSDAG